MGYRPTNVVRISAGVFALAATGIVAAFLGLPALDAAAFAITAFAAAFLVNFPVPLGEGRRSLVHLVGLGAVLFYAPGGILIALAVGLVGGAAIYTFWSRAPAYLAAPLPERIGRAAFDVGQLLLSHAAAVFVWALLGGRSQIGIISASNAVPVAGLVVTHLTVEAALLALNSRLSGGIGARVSVREFQIGFATSELVPIPFAVFGATLLFQSGVGAYFTYALLSCAIVAVLRRYALTAVEAQRRYEEVASLSNVSRALRTSLDLGALLDMIYLQVAHLLRVDNFYIALYDATMDIVSFSIAVRAGKRVQWKSRPSASRLTDHVIRTSAPLVITRDMHGYLTDMGMDLSGDVPNAWMGVPLMSSDSAIGCMAVLTYQPGATFTPDMLGTFSAIAAQAGVAIENAQLYGESQRRAAELRTLTDISALLASTLQQERVLELVSSSVLKVFNTDKTAIFLYESPREELFLARAEGMSDAYMYASLTLPLSETARVKAFSTGEPQIIVDVADENVAPEIRALAAAESFRALVDVPLRGHGEIIGQLAMYFAEPRRFRPTELELLNTFAAQAAMAVANARAYATTDRALARKVDQLQALEAIGRELASTLDVEGLFDTVLNRAMDATSASAGTLTVRDEPSGQLRLVAHRGYDEERLAQLAPGGIWPIHQGIIGRVMRTGQIALVNNVYADPEFVVGAEGVRSHLSVPIQRESETQGVVTLESDQEAAFSPEDSEFVAQLAVQAAVALSNARLYATDKRRLRELSVLYEASAALASTLETETILRAVAKSMVQASNARACAIFELDAVSRTLVQVAEYHRDGGGYGDIGATFHLDDYPATMRVLIDREPLLVRIDDPEADPSERALLEDYGESVMLALPIVAADRAIGLIELYDNEPRDFDENELRLLQTLATQAGVAFENARLFERISEGRDRLEAVLNATRDGVLLINSSGRIAIANPRVEEFWGVPRETLVGHRLDELAARQDQPLDVVALLGLLPGEMDDLLESVRHGTTLPTVKVPYRIEEPQPRFLERTTVPVADEAGKIFGQLIVLRDITEEKELEQVREDLSNMIVHDLRSPMTSVLGSLKLIEDILPESEKQGPVGQAIEVGERSSRRLLTLVDSLLDISRFESGAADLMREPSELRPIVDSVIKELGPLALEQDIALNNEVPPDLGLLLIDREKVERVFINLIDNALKFTPPGGAITVMADGQSRNGHSPKHVLVSILDDGPGIPDEQRERIFDRFAQVVGRHGRRRGTGLGLAFVKLAVEAHGGRIWVDNRPEGGSAFRFELPCAGVT